MSAMDTIRIQVLHAHPLIAAGLTATLLACSDIAPAQGAPADVLVTDYDTGLALLAAPTFAAMALLTALGGGGPLDALCASASPLGGMVPMYLLMSAFHLAPWFSLLRSCGASEASASEFLNSEAPQERTSSHLK